MATTDPPERCIHGLYVSACSTCVTTRKLHEHADMQARIEALEKALAELLVVAETGPGALYVPDCPQVTAARQALAGGEG